MKKFYITTAIDYVNDVIHIGHIYQKILADTLARYYRIKLGTRNVFFLTGTDEYGQKAQKAAQEAGISTKDFVDKIARADQKQQDSVNISYDRFIRTTDEDHTRVAQEIWRRVERNNDIYLGNFVGLYCPGCEAYYTEKDLVNGKCQFHPTLEVKTITEKNFFFKWSKYQDFLIKHIEKHPKFVIPESRRQEIINFAKGGIQDIPISRTSFKWGIPVPNHPGHFEYVWFDALTNYLTGIGFLEEPKKFEKLWPADIHILGTDNLRWHALLWPAILKSAGLKLPKTILVNGFLKLNGQKISKSSGNIIRPTEWVGKYGVDALRYYLLRYTTVTEDSDISEEKLKAAFNADLANGLGNLIARVAKLCERSDYNIRSSKKIVLSKLRNIAGYSLAFSEYRFNDALMFIWIKISTLDKFINDEKPWGLIAKDTHSLKEILTHAVEQIQEIAVLLEPFLPETAGIIKTQFQGPKILSNQPLFPRIY